jgi:hypothetical protein
MKSEMLVLLEYILLGIFMFIGLPFLAWKATRFRYSVEEKHLLMKWYFLGIVPIRIKIRLDSIETVEKVPLKYSPYFEFSSRYFVYGKPSHEMILITRKRGFLKKVVISPKKPDELIAKLQKIVKPNQSKPENLK